MNAASKEQVIRAQAAIDWSSNRSPILARVTSMVAASGRLHGRRIAVVTHLEPKAAAFICRMAETGAKVLVSGSNPHTTRASVVQALRDRDHQVFASGEATMDAFEADMRDIRRATPDIILDDGAELTTRLVREGGTPTLMGVSEQTTTGVTRLRELEVRGLLSFPALAGNDAASKRLFDNRHATGQGFVHAFMGLTNLTLLGKGVLVFGYGPVGRGVAQYARSFGARVSVVEIDPLRGLEAHVDGFQVVSGEAGLPATDVLVTATGRAAVVGRRDFPLLKHGAILCNVGHAGGEIDVKGLEDTAHSRRTVRPHVTAYTMPNEREVYVLTSGELVNIAGAEGHPIEIMDLSFSVQMLGAYHLAAGSLESGMHSLPPELDALVAREALTELGIELGHV
jgi:adenosylhomocysteinase